VHLADFTKHKHLAIIAAIIIVAFYFVLYGFSSIYLPCCIILAFSFYWVRARYRMLYGIAEFLVGAAATTVQYYSTGRGDFSSDFSNDFSRVNATLVLLSSMAGIYFMVRGIDNFMQGWRARYKVPPVIK